MKFESFVCENACYTCSISLGRQMIKGNVADKWRSGRRRGRPSEGGRPAQRRRCGMRRHATHAPEKAAILTLAAIVATQCKLSCTHSNQSKFQMSLLNLFRSFSNTTIEAHSEGFHLHRSPYWTTGAV